MLPTNGNFVRLPWTFQKQIPVDFLAVSARSIVRPSQFFSETRLTQMLMDLIDLFILSMGTSVRVRIISYPSHLAQKYN